MREALRSPVLVALISLILFSLATWAGVRLRSFRVRRGDYDEDESELIARGMLVLLGLIIGFSFSAALGRHDQRNSCEKQEANAIETAYSRADLLPADKTAQVRELLREYVDRRIEWYTTRDPERLRQLESEAGRILLEVWTAVVTPGSSQSAPLAGLVVSAVNDVSESIDSTRAAWLNHIPAGAWQLLATISVLCNLLIGYRMQKSSTFFAFLMPVALSITLYLIADIDAPRKATVHIRPENLETMATSFGQRAPFRASKPASPVVPRQAQQ